MIRLCFDIHRHSSRPNRIHLIDHRINDVRRRIYHTHFEVVTALEFRMDFVLKPHLDFVDSDALDRDAVERELIHRLVEEHKVRVKVASYGYRDAVARIVPDYFGQLILMVGLHG